MDVRVCLLTGKAATILPQGLCLGSGAVELAGAKYLWLAGALIEIVGKECRH